MKRLYFVLFTLIFSFILISSCSSSQKIAENPLKLTEVSMEKMNRGNRMMLVINSDKITNEYTYDATQREIKSSEWEQLNLVISDLDLKSIETWEAPTQLRLHDGAMATTIFINIDGQIYASQTFDEGNPPAELLKLYNYLVSFEVQ